MLLRNFMEDKQLDFNQPLLSVRRFSPTVVSEKDEKRRTGKLLPSISRAPPYISELKSGPVSNPGAVPFVWEQSPGRPKDESRPQIRTSERPPIAPKLPPGRIQKASQQDSDQSPRNGSFTKCQTGNLPPCSQRVPSLDENSNTIESFKEAKQDDTSDSGDSEEAYLDARDTLSRTESFFVNCSISGVSGLEEADMEPSGHFLTDPQTRDFMMGRFLPAAKAMASDTPQHAPRKQPVVQEQPRQLKKVTNANKRPLLRYGPSFQHQYMNSHVNVEEESDDDYDELENLSAKACGLLPRFCLKSSFCLLNPVPGISVRTRTPMSPINRTQAGSSPAGSGYGTERELLQQSRSDTFEQRSISESHVADLDEDKSCSNHENQVTWDNDHQSVQGSPLYRQLQSGSVSPCPTDLHQLHDVTKGVLGLTGEGKIDEISRSSSHTNGPRKNFHQLLTDHKSSVQSDSGSSLIVEKTLYVDTIHKMESPNNISFLPDISKSSLKAINCKNDMDKMEEAPSADSSIKDFEKSNLVEKGAVTNVKDHGDFLKFAADDNLDDKVSRDPRRAFQRDQDPIGSADLVVRDSETSKSTQKQPPNSQSSEKLSRRRAAYPAPPPLPKSPSDSWLCRTLPSMSTKSSLSHSYLNTGVNQRNATHKAQCADPKWETKVKTSKAQHQHLRYSEELLTPIPET